MRESGNFYLPLHIPSVSSSPETLPETQEMQRLTFCYCFPENIQFLPCHTSSVLCMKCLQSTVYTYVRTRTLYTYIISIYNIFSQAWLYSCLYLTYMNAYVCMYSCMHTLCHVYVLAVFFNTGNLTHKNFIRCSCFSFSGYFYSSLVHSTNITLVS